VTFSKFGNVYYVSNADILVFGCRMFHNRGRHLNAYKN
jgi:hypothetical protein